MTQSQHYERLAEKLSGAAKERALRAAQNHLVPADNTYMSNLKRLQDKLAHIVPGHIRSK